MVNSSAATVGRRPVLGAVLSALFTRTADASAVRLTSSGLAVRHTSITDRLHKPTIRTIAIIGDSYASSGSARATAHAGPGWGTGPGTLLMALTRGALRYDPAWEFAVGGGTTINLLTTVRQAIATGVDACIVQGAHNDTIAGIPFATTIANYKTVIEQLMDAGILPIIVLDGVILNTEGGPATIEQICQTNISLNRWKREYCALHLGLPVWDWEAVQTDPISATGGPVPEYIKPDDVHPSPAADQAFAARAVAVDLVDIIGPVMDFFPISQIDQYDATWCPRGNLVVTGKHPDWRFHGSSGANQNALNWTSTFLEAPAGRTQNYSFAPTYPGQSTPPDHLGDWVIFALSGTGTAATPKVSALIFSNNTYAVNPNDMIEAGCEFVCTHAGPLTSPWMKLSFKDVAGHEVYTAFVGFEHLRATPSPILLPLPRVVVPTGAVAVQVLLGVDLDDSGNT
jgi:lysophospholipase L1-like esterase